MTSTQETKSSNTMLDFLQLSATKQQSYFASSICESVEYSRTNGDRVDLAFYLNDASYTFVNINHLFHIGHINHDIFVAIMVFLYKITKKTCTRGVYGESYKAELTTIHFLPPSSSKTGAAPVPVGAAGDGLELFK